MLISQIKWSPSDTLFEIGGFSIYMYSLMFVVAFVLGYQLVKSFFTKEKIDHKYLDPMFEITQPAHLERTGQQLSFFK